MGVCPFPFKKKNKVEWHFQILCLSLQYVNLI